MLHIFYHNTTQDSSSEVELQKKHQILQEVIVNHVYLGTPNPLTEEFGFGTGPQAYAKLQCAMSDHEGDPLIGQYASSAMMKIFEAAGLDLSTIEQAGAGVAPDTSQGRTSPPNEATK
jgi:hypothetical protein